MPVIAIDGPAAAGKGTLSRRIAEGYGFHHLDTGLTYRACAKALLDAGLPLDDERQAAEMALKVDLSGLDRAVLSAHAIGEAASKIAVMPSVRRALVEAQRAFSRRLPGTVLDGRDIGTVVCPDASVKLYVTASAEVRAKRRFDEIVSGGGGRFRGCSGRCDQARRARHEPRRQPLETGGRCALDRYDRNGYRGRIPGGETSYRRCLVRAIPAKVPRGFASGIAKTKKLDRTAQAVLSNT